MHQNHAQNHADLAEEMRLWMQKRGIEAHVTRLPDGSRALIPGPRTDRSRQARWDAKNRITVSCGVPIETAEAFREACYQEGYTPYAVLRRYIEVVVREHRRLSDRRASARPGGPPRSSARPRDVGAERKVEPGPGTPRGRSPRPPGSMPSAPAGLAKPQPRRRPYDWEKDGDAS